MATAFIPLPFLCQCYDFTALGVLWTELCTDNVIHCLILLIKLYLSKSVITKRTYRHVLIITDGILQTTSRYIIRLLTTKTIIILLC